MTLVESGKLTGLDFTPFLSNGMENANFEIFGQKWMK